MIPTRFCNSQRLLAAFRRDRSGPTVVVAEIANVPDAGRKTICFYELPVTSLTVLMA
jgi:hypothetical protein